MHTASKQLKRRTPMKGILRGRVTDRTPVPYLARVIRQDGQPSEIVIFVTSVERPKDLPVYGRATVVSSRKGAMYYVPGEVIAVDNFKCLQRIELTSKP